MKVVFLFPGYGSQFVGMGKELYDDYRIVQEYFEEASQSLNINFVKLCFASSDAELAKIGNAYPVLFLISSAIYALFKDEEIKPSLLIGNNIGDYAAIAASGGMSLPDGLYLLNKYANMYHDFFATQDVGMIRIEKTDNATVEKICAQINAEQQQVDLAVSISAHEHLVSGTQTGIAALKIVLDAHDIAYVDDELGYEMHSSLAQVIADSFKPYLNKVDFKNLTVPVMRSSDAQQISTAEEVAQTIVDRITKPVRLDLVYEKLADADLIAHFGLEDRQTNTLQALYPDIPLMLVTQRSDIMEIKKIIQMQPQTEK